MARPRNQVDTAQITLSTTPMVRQFLEALVHHGTFGKNAAEAAERLLTAKITELRNGGDLIAESLNKTWLREVRQAAEGEARAKSA